MFLVTITGLGKEEVKDFPTRGRAIDYFGAWCDERNYPYEIDPGMDLPIEAGGLGYDYRIVLSEVME